VLFEDGNRAGYIHGFTENYVKVRVPWDPCLTNTLQQVILDAIDEDGFVRSSFVEIPASVV
jgi:threonylcarbamoyladenosine tRNA methylthiotransferase MtaB